MRRYSLLDAHGVLFNSSILTAAVVATKFRSADVEFYLDLYANFLQYDRLGKQIDIQPVQINRALTAMSDDGLCVTSKEGSKRVYHVNGQGIQALVLGMVRPDRLLSMEEITFVKFIIETYGARIQQLILADPSIDADKVDHTLFDGKVFIQDQIKILERAIRDVEDRINEYEEVCNFVDGNLTSDHEIDGFIEKFSKRFTYRLSHRRTYRELFTGLPPEIAGYEFRQGFKKRRDKLLEPLATLMKSYLNHLQLLLER